MSAAPASSPRRRAVGDALAALQAGRFAECAEGSRALLGADPDDVEARLLLGLGLGGMGEVEPAARLLVEVARRRPDSLHPCADLADILRRAGRVDEARAQYEAALAITPQDSALRFLYARLLVERGEGERAMAELRRVLAERPGFALAENLLGIVLCDAGDMAGGIAQFRRAAAFDPGRKAGWANLAGALSAEGKFDEAFACYGRAIAAEPGDPQVRLNHAITLLKAGRLVQGFQDYEWRLRLPGHTELPAERLLHTLAPGERLDGMALLLTHEEGFGDTLQFLRYLPMLLELGARLQVWVPEALVRVIQDMPGFDPDRATVLTGRQDSLRFDRHAPMMSLPRVFATTLETIPRRMPYLRAEPRRAAAWASRLPDAALLRVGLVWGGAPRPEVPAAASVDRRRSAGLAAFAPFASIPEVSWISLQLGPYAAEAATPPPGIELHDPTGGIADFADTAALIANLDLVVSVDTATVHLAGGMGKPVFLLDRYDSCWRWLAGRVDSPWYPSLQIFRQPRPGDWEEPIAVVARRIADIAAA